MSNQSELLIIDIYVIGIKLEKKGKKIDLPESHTNEQCGTEL